MLGNLVICCSFLNGHLKQYFKIFFAFNTLIPTQCQNFSTQTVCIQISSTLFGPDLDRHYKYQNYRYKLGSEPLASEEFQPIKVNIFPALVIWASPFCIKLGGILFI